MEDRRASLVAAAFGGVAIGGFWLARPIKQPALLRVVEQWRPTLHDGPDRDAVAAFRVDFHHRDADGLDDSRSIEYRIVDARGISYPLAPMTEVADDGALKLSRGYAQSILDPHLAAYSRQKLIAEVPIAPLPPPEIVPLVARKNGDFSLVYHPGSGIYVEPKRTVPDDERWRIVSRRSLHSLDAGASALVSPLEGRKQYRLLAIPFAEKAGAVEVDVERLQLVPHSQVVHLTGMRLVRRFGGTALVVDRDVSLACEDSPTLALPRQDNGPRHPLRHADPRTAFANFVAPFPPIGPHGAPTPGGVRRTGGPYVDILSPEPESLGLRELHIGSGYARSSAQTLGPLKVGPFTATLRLTFYRPVRVASYRTVTKVDWGEPLPPSYTPGSFGMPRTF